MSAAISEARGRAAPCMSLGREDVETQALPGEHGVDLFFPAKTKTKEVTGCDS
jgi:hypothetical protein